MIIIKLIYNNKLKKKMENFSNLYIIVIFKVK